MLLIINDVMNERYLSGKVSLIVFMAKTTYFRLSLIPISRIIVSTSDMGRYICWKPTVVCMLSHCISYVILYTSLR